MTRDVRARVRTPGADFVRRWAVVTLLGAALMSTLDAVLLQRARSFFTGGFLSVDHLTGSAETLVFLGVSVVADAAVLGLAAAVVMWLLCRITTLRASACGLAGLLAGLAPLVAADFISYEIARYLGDAADVSLMLDLTGQNPGELLAVASSHLVVPGLLIAVGGGMAGGVIWLVNQYSTGARAIRTGAGALRIPVLVSILGLASATIVSATSDAMENGLRRKPSGRTLAWIVDTVTDVDRDGFGLGGRMGDPDILDPSVFPYAVDVPGNSIDEDGVGGDLPASTPAYAEAPPPPEPWARRPDVVLVVLESFRADVVGLRVNGRPVTPVFDSVAARGISSGRAYSHNGYTAQSRYHLLSGSLAAVRDDRTLIDDFKRNGYTVAYFSGQDESFGGVEYGVGFERADVSYDARVDPGSRYSTSTTAGSLAVPFSVVQERVIDFLRNGAATSQPLFLYLNFHDTHFPYWHDAIQTLTSAVRLPRGRIAPDRRDELRSTYFNTAANVDRAVGDVLEALRRARGTEPAILVTADHGESLFDEGFLGHGYALNDVQTRIPLIAANLPLVIREPFGQRDLRDAIGEALRTPEAALTDPRVLEDPDREVFQYLGTLDRPRQIAFLRNGHRTVYDFRSRRTQTRDGSWLRPDELTHPDRTEFLRLIRAWERMTLARRARGQNAE